MSEKTLKTKIKGNLFGEKELYRSTQYGVDLCHKKGYTYSRNRGEKIMKKDCYFNKPGPVPSP